MVRFGARKGAVGVRVSSKMVISVQYKVFVIDWAGSNHTKIVATAVRSLPLDGRGSLTVCLSRNSSSRSRPSQNGKGLLLDRRCSVWSPWAVSLVQHAVPKESNILIQS
jgi:hypothetical protein